MRILFVQKETGYLYGGVENHVRELVKRLAARGHEVTLLTRGGPAHPLKELESLKNVKIVYLSQTSARTKRAASMRGLAAKTIAGSLRLTALLRRTKALPWLAKTIPWIFSHRKEFDVVSVHTFTDTVAMRAINRVARMPYAAWLEGYDYIEAENAKKSRVVATISEYMYGLCSRVHGYRPMVIPIGVDRQKFQNVNPREVKKARKKYARTGELLVLNVARLTESKGIPNMVKAAALARKKRGDLKFVVCGDGEQRPLLDKMVRELRLGDCFYIVKAFGSELPAFYNAADIFVHVPKFGNHFGVVYLEAMAAGLPIVAANAEASPLTVGDAALLVETENPRALADAITRLAENKALREKLSEKADRRAREKFDWGKIIVECEKLYKKAIAAYGG